MTMTETGTARRFRRAAAIPMIAAASMLFAACSAPAEGGDEAAPVSATGFNLVIDDCEDPAAATAVIEDVFRLGYSAPLSGPVAGPVELAQNGYTSRIAEANANDEVPGITIEYEFKDDGYTPDKAKANATEFLQKGKVDGLNTFGAGQVGVMADDQNAACVPLLYPSSSDTRFNDMTTYPWTVQFLPSVDTETKFLVEYIKQNAPADAKVGIVSNASASGEAQAKSFARSAEAGGLNVIAEAEDTDPNAAATTMKEAGVDVIYHGGIVGSCGVFDTALERIGFKPDLVVKASNCTNAPEYIAAGAAADGVVIPMYLKDPANPDLADDPAVTAFLKTLEGKNDPGNAVTISGWMQADLLVNTLKQAAESPEGLTRESIIRAARDQNYESPMLLDGITWKSTSERAAGVSGFAPVKWSAQEQRFVSAGDVVNVD